MHTDRLVDRRTVTLRDTALPNAHRQVVCVKGPKTATDRKLDRPSVWASCGSPCASHETKGTRSVLFSSPVADRRREDSYANATGEAKGKDDAVGDATANANRQVILQVMLQVILQVKLRCDHVSAACVTAESQNQRGRQAERQAASNFSRTPADFSTGRQTPCRFCKR